MNIFTDWQKDWKHTYAMVVVYGYMYDIIFWPFAFWGCAMATMWTGVQFPAPPLVPWEQLAVATANLAVIGVVQLRRDKIRAENPNSMVEKTVTETEVKVTKPESVIKATRKVKEL